MRPYLPWILAGRELRAGARGFRILIACLALGVGTIAAVQSLSRDIVGGIESQGRSLLGGDVAIRAMYKPATGEQKTTLGGFGALTEWADLRGMARTMDGEKSSIVELKAVDAHYPLAGKVEFATPAEGANLADLLAKRGGIWGAVVEPALLDRLNIRPGDHVKMGTLEFEIRAPIAKEPDRVGSGAFTLGPRFMISFDALAETGLTQPGSMIYYDYRLLLPPDRAVTATLRALDQRFANTGWRIRDSSEAAPQVKRFITRLATFLTLVGLTALLVGGVGVGNAVKSYLEARIGVIATMKCLGAPGRLIAATYLIQVMALSLVGIAIGVVIGALVPWAARDLIESNLPVDVSIGVHPLGLALAAAYGLLIALPFSLWPIGRARAIPAQALFRDRVTPTAGRPDAVTLAAAGLSLLALVALVLLTNGQWVFSAGFAGGAAASFLLLGGAAICLSWLARRAGRLDWARRHPTVRLALANLHRPGAATISVVLSLGLGLSILVAIAQVESNFRSEVEQELPAEAPAYFFLDIQPADRVAFEKSVLAVPGAQRLEMVPSLRGRIAAARGLPVEKAVVDRRNEWVLSGDRGLTYAATLPPRSHLIAGTWWPANYSGPPEVSVSIEVAQALGLKIGDQLTVTVVGRDLSATVANIRQVDWGGLGINFALVFAPGLLDGAPQTLMATVYAPQASEAGIERLVNRTYPGVTMIGVRDALGTVDKLIRQIGTAVRLTAGVALAAGTLVLAGAIASGERRRIYDSVVLKVLGATRRKVVAVFMIEHGLLGLMAAGVAGLLGTVAAWAVIVPVMDLHWRFDPMAVAGVAAISAMITLAFGLMGTWRALGQKAAPLLRNE